MLHLIVIITTVLIFNLSVASSLADVEKVKSANLRVNRKDLLAPAAIRDWLKELSAKLTDGATGSILDVKKVSLSDTEYTSVTLSDVTTTSTTGTFDIDLYKGSADFEGIIKITAVTASALHFKLVLNSYDVGVSFAGVGALLQDSTATPKLSSSIIKSDDTTLVIEFSGTFAVGQYVAFNFNLPPTAVTHLYKVDTPTFEKKFVVTYENVEFDDGDNFINYEISTDPLKITLSFLTDDVAEYPINFSAVDQAFTITSYLYSLTETTSAQKNQITVTHSNGILTISNFSPIKVGEKVVIYFTI